MKYTAAQTYIKQIKRELTCGRRWKRRLMREANQIVSMYLTDVPQASLEEMYAALGEPADMAEELLGHISGVERRKDNGLRRQLRQAAVIGLLVVTVGEGAILAENLWQVEVTTVVYTSEPEEHPAYWPYAVKYGLCYSYNILGKIDEVTDKDGNKVAVDADGIPLDREKYSITEGNKQ